MKIIVYIHFFQITSSLFWKGFSGLFSRKNIVLGICVLKDHHRQWPHTEERGFLESAPAHFDFKTSDDNGKTNTRYANQTFFYRKIVAKKIKESMVGIMTAQNYHEKRQFYSLSFFSSFMTFTSNGLKKKFHHITNWCHKTFILQ